MITITKAIVLLCLGLVVLVVKQGESASLESSRADMVEVQDGSGGELTGADSELSGSAALESNRAGANGSAESELEDNEEAPSASGNKWANMVDEQDSQDSNIENAKIELGSTDLSQAAGHHYGHHGHYVSGKMSMGAHSGHKGAFGWHAKFPVGGKGRR